MRAIILAGGFATRLDPITRDRAKPLLPVGGRPIIDHLLDKSGLPKRPIISTNSKFAPQFEQWAHESKSDAELIIEPSSTESEKLGTIGALAHVVDECNLDEDVLVIAGDNIFGFDLRRFHATYRGDILVALFDVGDPDRIRNKYGAAIVQGDRVVEFQEKPEVPKSSLASTACYVYPRQVLHLFREYRRRVPMGGDAPGFFNEWCLRELEMNIDAFVFDSYWFDIGDRASYLEAQRHFLGEDSHMRYGEASIENSDVTGSFFLGNSVVRNSRITGCIVDTDCTLTNVHLADCLVGRGSVLSGDAKSLAEANLHQQTRSKL